MKTGTDRSSPGYPGGTRHPCPFCDWFLDAEPISDVVLGKLRGGVHQALSMRFDAIHREILKHMGTEHPGEYRNADQLTVEGTYR